MGGQDSEGSGPKGSPPEIRTRTHNQTVQAARQELVDLRRETADEVAEWIRIVHGRSSGRGRRGRSGPSGPTSEHPGKSAVSSGSSLSTIQKPYSEMAANAALTLINIACYLLDRQVDRLVTDFEKEGGFTERLYRTRSGRKR